MFWPAFKYYPFQTATALYVIANGILSFHANSIIFDNLWNLIGGYSTVALVAQILAGILIIYGMGFMKSNIEAAGLVWTGSVFIMRAISLLTDNDITLSDVHASIMATLIL